MCKKICVVFLVLTFVLSVGSFAYASSSSDVTLTLEPGTDSTVRSGVNCRVVEVSLSVPSEVPVICGQVEFYGSGILGVDGLNNWDASSVKTISGGTKRANLASVTTYIGDDSQLPIARVWVDSLVSSPITAKNVKFFTSGDSGSQELSYDIDDSQPSGLSFSFSYQTSGTGAGSVVSSISSGIVEDGCVVSLSASPSEGSSFSKWVTSNGETFTSNSITVTVTSDLVITAVFDKRSSSGRISLIKPVISTSSSGITSGAVTTPGIISGSVTSTGFTDVKDSDWFSPAVQYVASNGLMLGVNEQQFNPKGIVTRGMLATVMQRYIDLTCPSFYSSNANNLYNAFGDFSLLNVVDVNSTDWYSNSVNYCLQTAVMTGFKQKLHGSTLEVTFVPGDPTNKEQVVTVVNRVLKLRYPDITALNLSSTPIRDLDEVSWWAKDDVECMLRLGIVNGMKGLDGNLYFFSNKLMTRAELAQLLYKSEALVKSF